jgi:hypothetical protein
MRVAGEGDGGEERVTRLLQAAEFKGRNLRGKMYILGNLRGKMYILSEKTKRFSALNIF